MKPRTILNDEEWKDFWADFFGEDILENDNYWKNNEKMKHRKSRRYKRIYKKALVIQNERREEDSRHHSLYRLVDNGKNRKPSKPIPKREKQRVFSSYDVS